MTTKFTKQQRLAALTIMLRSRFFEQAIETLFQQHALHGTTHLSIGQEASHTGLALGLCEQDWVVPTHRCHGITIARGASLFELFCEMYGSEAGICKGLGGSMHMSDKMHYNTGSSSVVGSGVSIACGIALSMKKQQKDSLAVAIFGDGASSRGVVHEAMNIASVWNLPVLFFCEHNGYGMSSKADVAISAPTLKHRADAYAISYVCVDGNDVEAVWSAVRDAAQLIKDTQRPLLLEVQTYRLCGHSKSDSCIYRSREEEAFWKKRCPIETLKDRMIHDGELTEDEYRHLCDEVLYEVGIAQSQAEAVKDHVLPFEQALHLVYAGGSV